jgi:hypothetical protein
MDMICYQYHDRKPNDVVSKFSELENPKVLTLTKSSYFEKNSDKALFFVFLINLFYIQFFYQDLHYREGKSDLGHLINDDEIHYLIHLF